MAQNIAPNIAKLTSDMITQRLARIAARLPTASHTDNRGRRDSADTTGIVIGSATAVECSYCVESTDVTYVPPSS